jgi:aminoglycoside/choline kinase family phosphotransferase
MTLPAEPPANDLTAHTTAPSVTWADPERRRAFEAWLLERSATHDLAPQSLRPASADASFRRYLRIDRHSGESLVIMDAPPDKEDCRPFVQVAHLMEQAGLRVPEILHWDQRHGFLLLSDLGRQTMMQWLQDQTASARPLRGQAAHDLYLAAVEALVRWQSASRADVLPPYDDALLSRELDLFPQWYVGQHRGLVLQAEQAQTLAESFALIKRHNLQAQGGARVYVHRDYMPRNLMADAADPTKALGILDFQDAVYGPISYDVASLMRDAFISWDEEFVIDITVRYWQQARQAGLPLGDDFGEFYEAVEWMGLQRHLKILGIFARLTLRDGKPQYLADTPRFIGYVRQTASRYRPLAPLLRLLEQIEGGSLKAGYTF